MMFDIIIKIVLKHEGGYVNDPDDLGGETKYGITKARYPNLDIKNLTKDEAVKIYKRDFWIPMGVEKIENMNLALNYFDMGVNAGITVAKDMLKRTLEIKSTSSKSAVQIYKELRIAYYKKIAAYRNNQKFLAGWLNRVETSNIA